MNNSGWVKEILRLLANNKNGMSLSRLAREMRISPEEKIRLRKNINTLETQGLILKLRKKYFIRPGSNVIHGRFTSSARGFGFVIPDEEFLGDIFIPEKFAGGAHHGDRVEVQFKESGRKGKPEGRIVRILQKKKNSLLGLCRVRSGQAFFLAFAAVSSQEIPIDCAGHPLPRSGDVVRVHRDTMCLEEILGSLDQPGVDTRIIIDRYDLEEAFSGEALEEANMIPDSPTPDQKKGRIDYTGWQTITIDGDNAQDFDDAISIESQPNGNFLLGVHIADVGEYVQEGMALDRNAKQRGTSVYFPDLTLPMLPEKLSNGICSLRPREEKLTLSVILEIDPQGCVQSVDIHPSWIRTIERMTYGSVMKIIEGDVAERKRFSFLVEDLLQMRDLAQALREKRISEGGLDFDLTEPELVYREGDIFSIIPTETNQAHHIIEEFMVLANEMVAQFLASRDIPLIFRVHPKPLPSDLDHLRELLSHFSIDLPKAQTMSSMDLQSVLDQVRGRPEEKFIIFRVLRSLRLAAYSDENCGHYGLAKEEYAHFTSPIRRYPDLIVHRILKRLWRGDKIDGQELATIALTCSQQERAAEEAERDLVEWRIYRFLKDRLGDDFGGIIVDFTKAGVVVELDDFFVSGLIPYSDLGKDYFYKKTEKVLSGRKTGKSFELGSHLRVILVAVDPIFRRMNLMLPERAAIGGQF